MNYTLTDFKGRYYSMPRIISDFLSDAEMMVFAQIYSASKKCLSDGDILVSQRQLRKLSKMGWRKVSNCIDTLRELNFLETSVKCRGTSIFRIKWDEIGQLEQFARDLTYDGVLELRSLCINENGIVPFSELTKKEKAIVSEKFKYIKGEDDDYAGERGQNQTATTVVTDEENPNTPTATICAKIAEMVAVAPNDKISSATILTNIAQMVADELGEEDTTATILTNIAEMVAVRTASATTVVTDVPNDNLPSATISTKSAQMVTDRQYQNTPSVTTMVAVACNPSSHFIEKDGENYRLNVLLSNAEALLLDALGAQMVAVELLTPETATISAKTVTTFAKTATTVVTQYKNNKYIKNQGKRSFPYIGEENKKENDFNSGLEDDFGNEPEILSSEDEWEKVIGKDEEPSSNESKTEDDVALPSRTEMENKKIRDWFGSANKQLPAYSSSEFDSIFSNPQFNNDEESRLIRQVWASFQYEEEEENLVPAKEVIRNILNGLQELQQEDENFSLTQQDAANIFSFDLKEQDGEFYCDINPKKVKMLIQEKEQDETSRREKKRNMRHGDGERMAIRTYVDCIKEIGNKRGWETLSAAEIVIYLLAKESGQYKDTFVKKAWLELKIKEWAEQYKTKKLSVEIFNRVCDGLQKRGDRVNIRPTTLFVDFVLGINIDTNQESDAERLYNKRMTEQQ